MAGTRLTHALTWLLTILCMQGFADEKSPRRSQTGTAVDTVVVCPKSFLTTLEPWLQHRRRQGHRFAFVSNQQTEQQICQQIRSLSKKTALKSVVLVGDVPRLYANVQQRAISVPTRRIVAKVNIHFGGSRDIASDNGYADIDGDQLPDLAVGRLPADNAQQLKTIVEKIIAFESSQQNDWKNRINVVAGVGGFGVAIDSAIEFVSRKFLADGIPPSYGASMTFASWQSPFCPDPRNFGTEAIDRFNDGCLFWVYIGHGHPFELDRVQVPNGEYPILRTADIGKMNRKNGAPIALMLACNTCAFDLHKDCLAEVMVNSAGGPVAVIGGTRVTMPYAMSLLTNSMMDHYFGRRVQNLGELFRLAKRQMIESGEFTTEARKQNEALAITLARLLSPNRNMLKDERYEHLWNFNLVGDPLLKLHQPKRIQVQSNQRAKAGEKLTIKLSSPLDAECRLELVVRRDKMKHELDHRRKFDGSSTALQSYTQSYVRANDRLMAAWKVNLKKGTQSVAVELPKGKRGPMYFRISAMSGPFAVGGTDVELE